MLPSWRKEDSAVARELEKRPQYASEAWLVDCYQEGGHGATAGKVETISEMLWQGIKRLDNNRLKSILFQKKYSEREFN